MVDDGLYDRVLISDIVLGQRSIPRKVGTVNLRAGPILSAADTFKIEVSGAVETVNPQSNINPIYIAYKIILKLQSLVNDRSWCQDFVAINCEETHTGQPGMDTLNLANFILDVKTYEPMVQENLYAEIKRIVQEECNAAGAPKPPNIKITVRAPLTSNSPEVVQPLNSPLRHTSRRTYAPESLVGPVKNPLF